MKLTGIDIDFIYFALCHEKFGKKYRTVGASVVFIVSGYKTRIAPPTNSFPLLFCAASRQRRTSCKPLVGYQLPEPIPERTYPSKKVKQATPQVSLCRPDQYYLAVSCVITCLHHHHCNLLKIIK